MTHTSSNKITQKNQGYALMMAMLTAALGAIVLGSLLEYSSSEITQAKAQNDSTRAFLIAQAGLESAKAAFINTNR